MLFFASLIVLILLPVPEEHEWLAWLTLCAAFVVVWCL